MLQVNGKKRGELRVSREATREAIEALVVAAPAVPTAPIAGAAPARAPESSRSIQTLQGIQATLRDPNQAPLVPSILSTRAREARLRAVLEQQFAKKDGTALLFPAGLTYSYDLSKPEGQRIIAPMLNAACIGSS